MFALIEIEQRDGDGYNLNIKSIASSSTEEEMIKYKELLLKERDCQRELRIAYITNYVNKIKMPIGNNYTEWKDFCKQYLYESWFNYVSGANRESQFRQDLIKHLDQGNKKDLPDFNPPEKPKYTELYVVEIKNN